MRAGSFESAAMSSAAAKTSEEAGAARVRNAASSGGNGAVEASINDGDGWDGVISMMLASCIS